jgi:hypothetical protein
MGGSSFGGFVPVICSTARAVRATYSGESRRSPSSSRRRFSTPCARASARGRFGKNEKYEYSSPGITSQPVSTARWVSKVIIVQPPGVRCWSSPRSAASRPMVGCSGSTQVSTVRRLRIAATTQAAATTPITQARCLGDSRATSGTAIATAAISSSEAFTKYWKKPTLKKSSGR